MKILHIYKDYYPVLGGIENHIRSLAESQVKVGHRVTVLVCHPERHSRVTEIQGVRVILMGRWTTVASMPISPGLPLILQRLCPDLIHVHSPFPLGELAAWMGKPRVPLVLTYHADVVRQKWLMRIYSPLFWIVLRLARRIIVTNPPMIESSRWLRPLRAKCEVVPLGIDVSRFSPVPIRLAGPVLNLLCVGRLRYYKGLDTLLRALATVRTARLVVVGNGPMRRPWEQLARDLGVQDRVEFVGDIPESELSDYYRKADLFVLPANARAEAFGTVFLEAMASGLPCIATELGTGTSWVVQHERTGLVIPPGDVAALIRALERMQSAEDRQRWGRAGRARVHSVFTESLMTEGVLRVYEHVMNRAPADPAVMPYDGIREK